ncbi:MAG: 6-phosphogluconolactonase [Acidobacteria bacterium]|nr:MAG: 6-phosphogluconolactonase [Acidobacteriota bacterium]
MAEMKVQIFEDLEALSRAAAVRFTWVARERAQQGKAFTAALSGGSTPRIFLETLASPEFSQRIQWESVHLFQVDERCVPPDDVQSNYRMIYSSLLRPVPGAAENFHRMKAERDDLDSASAEYEREISEVLCPVAGRLPRFDLVFLGLGPDGHTASLFPGSAALLEDHKWVCPNYVEKLKMHRLTLTYPVLNAAAEIVFSAAGPDKAEILRQVLEGPRDAKRLPAQGVQPTEGSVDWYLDKPAARLLRKSHIQRESS